MKVELRQTASNDDQVEAKCYLCGLLFYVGAATCWAISESNVLLGDVCPKCLQHGLEYMQKLLERNARFSRMQAELDEEIAAEGISDASSLDEFLAAEAFYVTPGFKTGGQYLERIGSEDRGVSELRNRTRSSGPCLRRGPVCSPRSTFRLFVCHFSNGPCTIT